MNYVSAALKPSTIDVAFSLGWLLVCVAGRITRTKDRPDFRIIVESIEQKTVHGDWDAAVCLFDRNIHEGLEKFVVENCRGFSSVSDKSPAIFLIL